MTTRKQLLAEVLTDLKQYNESGLIDPISLDLWVKNCLLKFGGNIMPKADKVLEIKNGMAKLPENFYALYLASKVTPTESKVNSGQPEDTLTDVYQYRVRKEAQKEWDNQSNTYKEGCFTEITEKIYFHDGRTEVEFGYGYPQMLRITKGFKKDKLCGTSLHLQKHLTSSSPYEISIVGDYLQTNFNSGFVYIQFQGLETDDEGDLIIPEVTGNYIFEYIIAEVKKKIFENLWTNKDDADVQNKVQYYSQQSADKFSNAMTAAKFEGIGGRWWKGMVSINKQRTSIYNRFAQGK
jgi:hypothetical protein